MEYTLEIISTTTEGEAQRATSVDLLPIYTTLSDVCQERGIEDSDSEQFATELVDIWETVLIRLGLYGETADDDPAEVVLRAWPKSLGPVLRLDKIDLTRN